MSLGNGLSNIGKGLLIAAAASAAVDAYRKSEERAAEERYWEYENQRAEEQREYERREAKRKLDDYNNSPEGKAENARKARIQQEKYDRDWKTRQYYAISEECYQAAKEETIRLQRIPVITYGEQKGQYFNMPVPGLETTSWPNGLCKFLIKDEIIPRMEREGIISKAAPNAPDVSGDLYYNEKVREFYDRKVLVPQKYEDWYACQNDWVKFCEKVDKMWNKFIKWYLG